MNVDKFGRPERFEGGFGHGYPVSSLDYNSMNYNRRIDNEIGSLRTRFESLVAHFDEKIKSIEDERKADPMIIKISQVKVNNIISDTNSIMTPIIDKYKREIEALGTSVNFYKKEIETEKNRSVLEKADDLFKRITS
ncbi:hypothetical protein QAD02_021560 [Eretmocerus hayati]|uniref:Uncharacterized protein n=1 Tax=Eretmocerus hayati TaxID=131215 RepID=A0ACC2PTR4_9HYME|nr:hypothetical protein QAD02_021560 [Eretmocerus hayati]